MPMNGEIGLYIHVPFCTKKCDYCHFFVVPDKEHPKLDWFLSLKKEWDLIQPLLEDTSILTLYFGGGSDSLLNHLWFADIISWINQKNTPQEITLEINPEDASLDKFKTLYHAGINRISLGVQTFLDPQLAVLGRLHTGKKAIQAILDAYEAGFRNISCDLMYDLPNQTLQDWKTNLDQMLQLPVTHLSLYNLTIEPNTPFHRQRKRLQPLLPEDTLSKEMFLTAIRTLTQGGFSHYEISAFCKNHLYALHNTGYWLGRPFLGLGPSAFSYHSGKRFQNAPSINRYKQMLKEGKPPRTFTEKLDVNAKRRELFTIGLRLLSGIPYQTFEKTYGPLEQETKDHLLLFEKRGWITSPFTHPTLTMEGILFYDTIAEELI